MDNEKRITNVQGKKHKKSIIFYLRHNFIKRNRLQLGKTSLQNKENPYPFILYKVGDGMKFKNPNGKKVRGSHVLLVSCAYCKTPIAKYRKVGSSGFIKMYNERIIEGNIDFSQYHGGLFCPQCGEQIATRYITRGSGKEAYRLHHSAFNKRKIKE